MQDQQRQQLLLDLCWPVCLCGIGLDGGWKKKKS